MLVEDATLGMIALTREIDYYSIVVDTELVLTQVLLFSIEYIAYEETTGTFTS
jgi:hypothetical protein